MSNILEKAKEIFDILEYSFVPSLLFVLPVFYKLRNSWSKLSATGTAARHVGRVLRRNLVMALDSKIWEDISALHIAASCLDPSLKGFSFVKDTGERHNLPEHAADIVKKNTMVAAKIHVYPTKELEASDVEVLENDEQEREAADEFTNKRTKYDPLAEFRNTATDGGPRKKSSNLTAEVNEELRRYNSITGVNLKQAHAIRNIFDPLLWWGEQRYSFPAVLQCSF